MRPLILFAFSALALAPGLAAERVPVLVELFTSEGCSSCPPADRLLAELHHKQPVRNAQIIVLSEHVDYWNRLGWEDPFSSEQFSRRQQWYSSRWPTRVYTPQAIIDGRVERLGSDPKAILQVVRAAATEPKAPAAITWEGGEARIDVQGLQLAGAATVYLAVLEDDLKTDVLRGENEGLSLPHVAVVRSLQPIDEIEKTAQSYERTVEIEPEMEWNGESLRLAVFVQENSTRKVVAATTTE